MINEMWFFLAVWFVLCLILLRILAAILNNKLKMLFAGIQNIMPGGKNSPKIKLKDVAAQGAMMLLPDIVQGVKGWFAGSIQPPTGGK